MIRPLNNMCLIEVIDDYEGIIRNTENEELQKGVLRDATLVRDHITASAGYEVVAMDEYAERLHDMLGKTVYWEEYADTGKKFEFDGKKFVLIPFYRLIGFEA